MSTRYENKFKEILDKYKAEGLRTQRAAGSMGDLADLTVMNLESGMNAIIEVKSTKSPPVYLSEKKEQYRGLVSLYNQFQNAPIAYAARWRQQTKRYYGTTEEEKWDLFKIESLIDREREYPILRMDEGVPPHTWIQNNLGIG